MDLEEIRLSIDACDEAIVRLFSKRLALSCSACRIKEKKQMPHQDVKREREILKKARTAAVELGIDASLVEALFIQILTLCKTAARAQTSAAK